METRPRISPGILATIIAPGTGQAPNELGAVPPYRFLLSLSRWGQQIIRREITFHVMRIWLLLMLALVVLSGYQSSAQPTFPLGPNGFTFTGEWECKGQFLNGKPHESHYSAEPVLGDAWLQLSEKDINPPGYLSQYFIRFDPEQKLYINEDLNNFGYARYTSPGWQDAKLVFTSTEAHYAHPLPENRFVYTVTGPKSFDVSWESRRDKNSDFKSSDTLHCQQIPSGHR